VNKKELKQDYERREVEKLELLDKINHLQDKHAKLRAVINQAAEMQIKERLPN
jgi:hypothetical protein